MIIITVIVIVVVHAMAISSECLSVSCKRFNGTHEVDKELNLNKSQIIS